MSNLVAKSEMESLAAEYLAEQKLNPLKVTIGQGSPEKGKVGHFNFESGESTLKLEGVSFVASMPSNVLFHGQGSRIKSAACASDDGFLPAPRILEPVSQSCHGCYAISWSQDGDENTQFKQELGEKFGHKGQASFDPKKPLCTAMINAYFLDSVGMPFSLQVHKHNLARIKDLSGLVQIMAAKNKAPGFALAFDLYLEPIEGKGNRNKLMFSKSSDWKVVSIEEAKSRVSLVKMIKEMGSGALAEKHAALDSVHQKQIPAPVEDWPPMNQEPVGDPDGMDF